MLLGREEFIHQSRWLATAESLAGAAIYALENNVDRLAEDHNAAKDMAEFRPAILGENVVAPKPTS